MLKLGRLWFQARPRKKKFARHFSGKKMDMHHHPSYGRKHKIGSQRACSKITREKGAGGVAQEGEPGKHEFKPQYH
jgi:hypothetical protein